MADGRLRSEWERTSLLCAVITNSAPFRQGEPVKPAAFNPYTAPDAVGDKPLMVPLASLRHLFMGKQPNE